MLFEFIDYFPSVYVGFDISSLLASDIIEFFLQLL